MGFRSSGRSRRHLVCLASLLLVISPQVSGTNGKEWVRRYIRSADSPLSEEQGDDSREARAPVVERVMYLNQGVEFVFPLGVHYTLANVNEQQNFPVPTTGFEAVLEFPRNKMAIMFSSMVNTLRLANFNVYSNFYTNDSSVQTSPAMRILGTDVKSIGLSNLAASTQQINKDIAVQTNGVIQEFIPKGAYYGSALYPFTKAVLTNAIRYENYWAWPWRDAGFDKFSDSPLVPYMEVEGLMPYYENEAFAAVAALFKGGTGSVVFLKPKGNVTILQLMLQPTALTEIFDENFPGWGVKTMRVKVPSAAFTTTTRHAETLQKRGVVDTFCSADIRESLFGVLRVSSAYFLNPIVQTNHVQISKDYFRIASATGATLNSQAEFDAIPRNEPIFSDLESGEAADASSSVEVTTTAPAGVVEDVSSGSSTSAPVVEEEVASTGRSVRSVEATGPVADSSSAADDVIVEGSTEEAVTSQPSSVEGISAEEIPSPKTTGNKPKEIKGGKRGNVHIESYVFDEPFLWFLHATNEEPMFMGIIESFKRYKEQGSSSVINLASATKLTKDGGTSLVDVIADTANINLWNC